MDGDGSPSSRLAVSGVACTFCQRHVPERGILPVTLRVVEAQARAKHRVAVQREAAMLVQHEASLRAMSRDFDFASAALAAERLAPRVRAAAKKKKQQVHASVSGLSRREIIDLQSRELGPEDYDLLLRLDESVPKKTLRPSDVATLLVSDVAAGTGSGCCICLGLGFIVRRDNHTNE